MTCSCVAVKEKPFGPSLAICGETSGLIALLPSPNNLSLRGLSPTPINLVPIHRQVKSRLRGWLMDHKLSHVRSRGSRSDRSTISPGTTATATHSSGEIYSTAFAACRARVVGTFLGSNISTTACHSPAHCIMYL